ncbi:MAG: cysteine--tRNA ligase [Rickettsiaceae bacterium]
MQLSLFNTLSKQKEIFTPIDANAIKMYVCGPTVYDHPHIGNARSVVIYDMLYRILVELFEHEKVTYVRNITDIDDKIIDRAIERNISIKELTQQTIQDFHQDMDYLNCLRPTIEPKATDHIDDMINIINLLLAKGAAYKAAGHVYFDVKQAQNYEQLSGQSFNHLLESVRKDASDGKRNTADFVLWKPAKLDDDASAIYDSPFGLGRPGWHIECSAMSHKFLGETFDIHGGGVDLVFPHHTNEIAQSCTAFPDSEYAKIWVHNGFLTVDHEKMSKSLGNFLTVQELRRHGMKGDVVRLFLLGSHYRKPLDYNDKAINDAKHMLNYWHRAIEKIGLPVNESLDLPVEFKKALLDDLNSYQAITIINNFAKTVHTTEDHNIQKSNAEKLLKCISFLGLTCFTNKECLPSDLDTNQIEQLINKRKQAKACADWSKADKIREALDNMGVVITDLPDGSTTWKIKNYT